MGMDKQKLIKKLEEIKGLIEAITECGLNQHVLAVYLAYKTKLGLKTIEKILRYEKQFFSELLTVPPVEIRKPYSGRPIGTIPKKEEPQTTEFTTPPVTELKEEKKEKKGLFNMFNRFKSDKG